MVFRINSAAKKWLILIIDEPGVYSLLAFYLRHKLYSDKILDVRNSVSLHFLITDYGYAGSVNYRYAESNVWSG